MSEIVPISFAVPTIIMLIFFFLKFFNYLKFISRPLKRIFTKYQFEQKKKNNFAEIYMWSGVNKTQIYIYM